MTPAVMLAVLALVAVVGLLVVEWDRQPRPRHAGAGVGALNVAQLVGQDIEHSQAGRHRLGEPTETAERFPEHDPDEHPASPPTERERTVPSDDLMQRVLAGLRAL